MRVTRVWSPSQTAEIRVARRRSAVSPDINLVGLLSVSLSLLIFLMLVPPRRVGITADLPFAKTATLQPDAVREDAVRISVMRDGRVYFRDTGVAAEDLPALIREAFREGAKREVFVAVDSRAMNGDVNPVIDQLRWDGASSVVILTNKPGYPPVRDPSH